MLGYLCIKTIDFFVFKRVINDASHLEYNYIHRDLEKITDPNLKDEEVEYLIVNQIHHRLLKSWNGNSFFDKFYKVQNFFP
ncbi:MAG: hypothetical protein ACLTWH_09290, partial [Lactobacillus paragasseri]